MAAIVGNAAVRVKRRLTPRKNDARHHEVWLEKFRVAGEWFAMIWPYAGSGRGCLGSSTKAAAIASNITNTIFRYIDGVGISTRFECPVADRCRNQFIEVTSFRLRGHVHALPGAVVGRCGGQG